MVAAENGGAVGTVDTTAGPTAGPIVDPPSRDTERETARLAQLHALAVLDSAPEAVFDSIVQMAAQACAVPMAMLTLVDAQRVWFKANVGSPGANEIPRDSAFCALAIDADTPFEVPDAAHDPRFADHPMVSGPPGIRFYTGEPLVLPGGARVGTLCVLDRAPRRLDAAQRQSLRSLAAIASQALVMRRDLIAQAQAQSARSAAEPTPSADEAQHRALVEHQSELISLARPDGTLVYVNPAYASHFGRVPAQMIGTNLFDYVQPADREAVQTRIERVLRTGESLSGENRMVGDDGSERWGAWTNRLQHDSRRQPMLHSVGRDVTERRRIDQALRASQAFLQRTGRVAGVGGWELELANSVITWSDETRRIHEVAHDHQPTLASVIEFYAPEARAEIEAAFQAAVQRGTPWDLELPLITATGRRIWVRTQGEVEFDGGKAARLVGAFQDITERKELEQRLEHSERFVRQITDGLPVRVAYLDRDRRFRFVNLAHCQSFGLAREQILGRTRSELTHGATDALLEPRVLAVLAGQTQHFEYDMLVGGERRRIEAQLVPDIAETGEVRGFYATGIDITERAAAERQQQRQAGTLRSVAEAIPAIVAVVGADHRYRFVNSAFERWCGKARDQVIGNTMSEVLGSADFERIRPWVEKVLMGRPVSFERDYPGRSSAGHLALTYTPLWLDNGEVDGFVGVAQDITPHKQEELRLLLLTRQDPLTGLLNRAGFQEHLERRLQDGSGSSLALLCIDLDHFKPVNDRHGHPVGDQVLQIFAQRLRALVRPTDAVARIGGDEFAIVLSGLREGANARGVAEKIIGAASAPFELGSQRVNIGASVGVAYGGDPELGWRDLVARADAMLYRAKESGRGRQAGTSRM